MKKKFLLLFTGILFLWGMLFTGCSSDSDSDDADRTPPAEIIGLNAVPNDSSVFLTWTNPADKDFYGVEVSAVPAEGTLKEPVVVKGNTITVTGLTNGTSYTFTLKTIDKSTNVSAGVSSENVSPVDSSDKTPPEEVTNLKLKVADGIAKLTWTDSVSEDVFGYEITYDGKKIEYASRSLFTSMAENTVFVSPGTQKYEFEVETGKEYSFTIKAVDTSGNKTNGITKSSKLMDVIEPVPFATRSDNLDFIFGTDSVAEITLTIDRSEWNTLLENYDTNQKNEDCIHADFKMTKGEYTWQAEDIGMRLRGNTSRIRPQQGDNYYQAHFKIDFEEWIEDDTIEEGKLAGCMKGIILKRFKDDPTYVREVFGYNFFRKNGIWTAPRAGYTRLFINIVEDGGKTTELDYGVYAMIEEINKQFLKERSENTPEIGTKFNGNKGNLWKCCWQSSDGPSMATDFDAYRSFGVEEIFLDETKSMRYDYDLKTNKDDLISARDEFIDFIYALNDLSTVEEIKAFYEKKMDVDLFLKTYACNVLLGMDDDYWNNKNNYYFYFDKKGKCYFIPYDYDNILGTNCFDDTATENPIEWGRDGVKAPLIEKLLSVPEYKQMYVDYLLELREESSFVTGSQAEIQRLQALVKDYIYSKDLTYSNTYSSISDDTAYWCTNYGNYKLLSGDENTNYFKAKSKSIADYTEAQVTFNLNAPDGKTVILIDNNGIPHSDEYFVIGKSEADLYDFYNSIYCEGYNFKDWYNAAEGGKLVSAMPSGEVTLYAHWSPKQNFTVTFDANGGTIIGESSVIFYEGDSLLNMPWITTPIKAEKENEFFWGWYDSSSGGKEVDTITENMTVYAQYKATPRLYEYWIDGSVIHLSFAFNPEDFGLSDYKDYKVIHACGLSDWDKSTVLMTKGVDGVYRCEYTSKNYNILSMWPGYKFIVDGTLSNSGYISGWTGPYDGYKYRNYLTAGETYENKPDYNFLIKELMSNYK
ncbi:MAG: CotH kinase family protein [Treponema porcinum]|uniref:CotH kinase family protein n=1 Tax=Treponema porcinum TaxID=261392 RepID=UPI002A833FE6|nr:CotH kinase family protein [Treponema porcinum]MDY4467633.1 CotH kinase family protein [Treponema porcinum]MDY5121506.1 CotH kinase family protein [Treponema porcinum]